ncbi:MAG: transporter substrate-binding domain-containing protein, partial [Mariprofundaceae bacterium]|nr:transporter substrate-binding domain-containing protein [Mariprofundaceae bacterium]
MGNRVILSLLFLAMFHAAFSEMSVAGVEQDKSAVVRVGAYENNPKIYVNHKDQVSGFWPELIEYIAAKEHWKIEYVRGSWNECLDRLLSGEIDVMPDVAFTEARNKRFVFSDAPELLSWTRVYVHKKDAMIKSITDLENKKVAVLRNSVNVDGESGLREIVSQFNLHITIEEMDDYKGVFRAIEERVVDAGITNRNYGNKNAHFYQVKKTPIIFQPIGMRFAFPKNSPRTPYLAERINTGISELQKDDQSFYYHLLKKFFEAEIAVKHVPTVPDWMRLLVKVLFGTLLLFGIFIFFTRRQVKKKTVALEANESRLRGEIIKLKETKERLDMLSQAVTQSGGSVMITDRHGDIEYVNEAFTKITGYVADEVIGRTPRILKSGRQDAAFYQELWQTIADGHIWHGKVIDKRKDGVLFPAMLTIAPILDSDGAITHFVGTHADISKMEELEHQFYQAQKMEAIGTLVGGIAHDFNNMLAGMTGNLFLVQQRVSGMPDVLQKLSNIERLSFRAADMIKQLLTFARKDQVNMKD